MNITMKRTVHQIRLVLPPLTNPGVPQTRVTGPEKRDLLLTELPHRKVCRAVRTDHRLLTGRISADLSQALRQTWRL
jgi:hypothetical protein